VALQVITLIFPFFVFMILKVSSRNIEFRSTFICKFSSFFSFHRHDHIFCSLFAFIVCSVQVTWMDIFTAASLPKSINEKGLENWFYSRRNLEELKCLISRCKVFVTSICAGEMLSLTAVPAFVRTWIIFYILEWAILSENSVRLHLPKMFARNGHSWRVKIVDVWRCWRVKMLTYEDVDVWRCWRVKMLTCEDVDVWRCWRVEMLTCEDVDVWRCWRVKMLTCEDVDVWRWQHWLFRNIWSFRTRNKMKRSRHVKSLRSL